jgi:hypothetical protein
MKPAVELGNQTQGKSIQSFRFGTWPSTCLDTFKECLYNRRIFRDAKVTVTATLHDCCAIELPFPVVLAHLLYVTISDLGRHEIGSELP